MPQPPIVGRHPATNRDGATGSGGRAAEEPQATVGSAVEEGKNGRGGRTKTPIDLHCELLPQPFPDATKPDF